MPFLRRLHPLLLLAPLVAGCGQEDAEPPSSTPQSATTTAPPAALEIGHVRGAEDAPLTIVEFSDFGCVACADFARESLPALMGEFVETGRVRWRFVPIRQGFFRGGEAARAAECVAEQGAFWEMHDLLLARQRDWQTRRDPAPILARLAHEAGADPRTFTACYASDRPDATLRLHDLVTLNLAIRAVPVFLVGTRRVVGALEAERFAQVVREELEKM